MKENATLTQGVGAERVSAIRGMELIPLERNLSFTFQPVPYGIGGGLGAVGDPDLRVDVADVR